MPFRFHAFLTALAGSSVAALAIGGCSPTADQSPARPAASTPPQAPAKGPATAPVAVSQPATSAAPAKAEPAPAVAAAPEAKPEVSPAQAPSLKRVGGDLTATVEGTDGNFRAGPAKITTPLPLGYPAPTPPGAIDMKSYPSVRRAEVSGAMAPDLGMNFGFFPLFNHIKRRNIEMTSPVEMDYTKASKEAADRGEPGRWTMSFLYRTSDLGATGTDEVNSAVKIIDTAPVTVLSLGFMGPYGINRVRAGEETLRTWLAGQTEWEAAGDIRTFSYNGPDVPNPRKWGEVQLPVKRASR